MKHLTNIYDPKNKNARRIITRCFGETQDQAWASHIKWLKGKVIGDPMPTETYTVQQLRDQNMVGVYTKQASEKDY